VGITELLCRLRYFFCSDVISVVALGACRRVCAAYLTHPNAGASASAASDESTIAVTLYLVAAVLQVAGDKKAPPMRMANRSDPCSIGAEATPYRSYAPVITELLREVRRVLGIAFSFTRFSWGSLGSAMISQCRPIVGYRMPMAIRLRPFRPH
jgi:hypothetical protein